MTMVRVFLAQKKMNDLSTVIGEFTEWMEETNKAFDKTMGFTNTEENE